MSGYDLYQVNFGTTDPTTYNAQQVNLGTDVVFSVSSAPVSGVITGE